MALARRGNLMRDDRLRRYFKALGDKTRFEIVQELGRTGECSVTELCLSLGVTQPLMSWHIRALRGIGIVVTRRHGRQVFCSLDRASIMDYEARFAELVAGRGPLPESLAPQKMPLPG